LLAYNPGTKPAPSSVLTYDIQDNSCHYKQWSSDVLRNRAMKADFYKKSPDFKKENPDTPWFTGLDANNDSNTRTNTQDNKKIEILSVTLASEAATFLDLIKKGQRHRDQQLEPVVDSTASRHVGNCH